MTTSSDTFNDHPPDRAELARMVTRLFIHWQLSTQAQLSLLGLSSKQRHTLYRYRKGTALPARRDLLDRVRILLGIHRTLRTLFPHDRDLAYGWMTQRNRAFEWMTPIEATRQWGFTGLLIVQSYLDRYSV